MILEAAAHDQPAVYEEGRSDNHPEADALVHVQLTYGLAYYRVITLVPIATEALCFNRPEFKGCW